MTQAGTVLPLTRCPGCRALLTGDIHAVDFGHPSPWWRSAVADGYPVCPRCYIESEADDILRERCVRGALRWWEMNETLRRYRAAEFTPTFVSE